jgi:hypothetical protein
MGYTETRGKAVLAINIKYFEIDNRIFALGFQYQGGTCKICSGLPGEIYWEKVSDEKVSEEIRSTQEKLEEVFKNSKGAHGYKKFNGSKTKTFTNIAKKIETCKDKMKFDDFYALLFREFESALEIIDELEEKIIKEKGGKFY